ncbi:MAG TPA: wax ester/triacylglycerol synthase family O-acyltransferase [Acidimicrobiales bacterium]|nr:wax ester/triacylglycerol synthase family O-acyltransferase [Acidimicrobiales bacterium]
MQTLNGLDAAFLNLETPTSHLHVTGVLVFDPATMPGGYSFDRVRRFISSRLGVVESFRRRLATVPFSLGRPVWIDDAGFDLDYHVRRAALPAPGGPEELGEFAAGIAGRPLDRAKPLWEMWFVEGVEGDKVALVAKMHHATIDGVSGANLMGQLLDLEPRPVEESLPEDEWQPERPPSDVELLGRALVGRAARRMQLVRTAVSTTQAVAGVLGRRLFGRGSGMATPFTAPATPFNGAITPHRRVAMTGVPLADVKAVKDRFGATVNEVVLAICGGALRRYLECHGGVPERPLLAAVPVSVRGADASSDGANQLSAMFVSLATDVDDPVERLHRVSELARSAKNEHDALGGGMILDLGEFVSSRIFGVGARQYSQLRMADRVPKPVNLIVSNVPGPDFPLYFAGAKLDALYPLGPIYDGMGLNVTVLSYLDTVGFGFITCAELLPDLWDLASGIGESLRELEKAPAARR